MKTKIFKILAVMVLLVPLGFLTQNPAWGEWEPEYYMKILGYIPKGIANAKGLKAILPDYSLEGINEVFGYYISATVGTVLIFVIFYILAKIGKNRVSKS